MTSATWPKDAEEIVEDLSPGVLVADFARVYISHLCHLRPRIGEDPSRPSCATNSSGSLLELEILP
eukprot:4848205-Amphidinium_carterae.1